MRAERRGREFYGSQYEEAVKLHEQGVPVTEIAKRLGVSYSAAYHWVRGLRKPEKGNVREFIECLRSKGPAAVTDIKEKFAKHNELFLIAARRGMPVKRYMLKKKYGEYATWYYLEGQESLLEERTNMLMEKIKEVREKLNEAMNKK